MKPTLLIFNRYRLFWGSSSPRPLSFNTFLPTSSWKSLLRWLDLPKKCGKCWTKIQSLSLRMSMVLWSAVFCLTFGLEWWSLYSSLVVYGGVNRVATSRTTFFIEHVFRYRRSLNICYRRCVFQASKSYGLKIIFTDFAWERGEVLDSSPLLHSLAVEIVDPPHCLDIAHRPKISLGSG